MASLFAEMILGSRSLKEIIPYGIQVELKIVPGFDGVHLRVLWHNGDWSGWHESADAALASARQLIKRELNLNFP